MGIQSSVFSKIRRTVLLTTENRRLVIRSAAAKRQFLTLERLFSLLDLLLARCEDTLFVSPDALVGVQAFENKFSRRNLHLGTVLGADSDFDRFFHQALDTAQ